MPQTGMPNSQAADPAAGAQPLYTAKAAQPFKATRLQLGAALYSYLLGWFYFCGLVLGGPVLPFAEWYVGSMNPVALGVFCALFFGGAEFFLRRAGRKAPAESWWWMGFSVLLLANLLIVRPLLYGAGYWNGRFWPCIWRPCIGWSAGRVCSPAAGAPAALPCWTRPQVCWAVPSAGSFCAFR